MERHLGCTAQVLAQGSGHTWCPSAPTHRFEQDALFRIVKKSRVDKAAAVAVAIKATALANVTSPTSKPKVTASPAS